jgi:hypothetical protein
MTSYVDPHGLAERFEPVLRSGVDLEDEALTVGREGRLRVVYVPFDLIRPAARLILVGLTPGEQQARKAIAAAREIYATGGDMLAAHQRAKAAASFAGPMRINLVRMLDAIGLASGLGLSTTGELFTTAFSLVHTTSALRYAVFLNGRNYSSAGPSPIASPMLRRLLIDLHAPGLAAVPHALVITLGKRATESLDWLVSEGHFDSHRCRVALPHPSGANVGLWRLFEEARPRLTEGVTTWFRGGT